jgi:hypothetical protein
MELSRTAPRHKLDPQRAGWRDKGMRALSLALVLALAATQFVDADPPPLHVKQGYGIRGLTLWITAEDGVTTDAQGQVTQLVDKTGNFTLAPPNGFAGPMKILKILNGHAILRFNGRESLFSPAGFGNAQDGAMTFIFVSLDTAAAEVERYQLYLGQNADAHCNRAFCQYQGKEVFDGQFVISSGPPVLRNVFFMDSASINANHRRFIFYRNGQKVITSGLAPENGNARFDNVSDGVTLGAAPTNLYAWEGDIAEALVFDRQLTPVEMQTLWTALSAKYSLGNQPAPAP